MLMLENRDFVLPNIITNNPYAITRL